MGKKKSNIEIRKEIEANKQVAIERSLSKARKVEKVAKATKHQKRKDVWFLSQYVGVPLGSANSIRSRNDYVAKSYNLGRQVVGLLDFVFVRYKVPFFLYRCMLSRQGIVLVFGQNQSDSDFWRDCGERKFVQWFMVAAQGGSLAKAMKDVLTKKEVHYFLQAPAHNTIVRNLFWARCAAMGLPSKVCQFLTEHLGAKNQQKAMGERLPDVIRFYATEYSRMRGNDLQEITDFVRAMIEVRTFSFKGRTFGSMVKLSQEWHRASYSVKVTEFKSWAPSYPIWECTQKAVSVCAVELTNSRALLDEGSRQRHCVWSYVHRCLQGSSKIVSLRWIGKAENPLAPKTELNRITMEIRPYERTIVQIRGKLNRRAEDHEMKVIRLWAGDHGLMIADY